MKKITVADMTLNRIDSELSFKEKVEVARNLVKIGVDVVELPPIVNERTDVLLVKTVAAFATKQNILSLTVGSEAEAEVAARALAGAKRARLRVSLPVSPTLMEYSAHKKAPVMLECIKTLVSKCASLCSEVEFFAADATRSEEAFLKSAISAALEGGAGVIGVSDDAGVMLPDEFASFIKKVGEMIPEGKTLSVYASDRMGMALASVVGTLSAGVGEVKVAVGREGVTSLEGFVGVMMSRGEDLGFEVSLNRNEFGRLAKQISWIINTKRDEKTLESIRGNSEGGLAGATLVAGDSREAVAADVRKLGYELSDEDNGRVYEEVMRVAEKKQIGAKELDAIVASTALQVPPTYKLVSFSVNCSNVLSSSANITLEREGANLNGISLGDGPIDASFLAIEQIVGHRFELDDFQIQSVTEGREAVGSALVKLRNNGKLYSGNGISTDIIGAAIRAYVNAINKIIYEEKQI